MKKIAGSIIVKSAIILFAVFCVITVIRLQFKNNDIKSEIGEMNEKLEAAEKNLDDLKRQADEPYDEEYISGVAKEKIGLRYPDEVIFYNNK